MTLKAFGHIDALINNAGYGLFGPFETADDADIEKQFATNLFGLFDVTRAVLPAMREQKSGVIVNVSSIGGLTTFPMNSLYHATKFAVVGFSESLNFELAPFNIRVKVVAPGGVSTDFAGRSLVTTFKDNNHPYAEAVGKTVAAFARNRARYSTPRTYRRRHFRRHDRRHAADPLCPRRRRHRDGRRPRENERRAICRLYRGLVVRRLREREHAQRRL